MKHTEEAKRKISEVLRKRIRSPETGRKISKAKMGHTVSEETRNKISQSKKGNSKSNSGSFQKGLIPWNKGMGITASLLHKVRSCLKYRQWRSDIFTRDDFTCQDCDRRGGLIEAHHPESFSDIMALNDVKTLAEAEVCEELWNINNGITLCKKCHKKRHGKNYNASA